MNTKDILFLAIMSGITGTITWMALFMLFLLNIITIKMLDFGTDILFIIEMVIAISLCVTYLNGKLNTNENNSN